MKIQAIQYISLSEILDNIGENKYAFSEKYSDCTRFSFGDTSYSLVNKADFLEDIQSWLHDDDCRLETIITRLRELGDEVFIDLES